MVFDINGKVALVTGGASGLGLIYVKELLRNGARGATIADMNPDFGQKAIQEIENEFGADKAIFLVCDVTKKEDFVAAFEKTIEHFKNIDILINNAGILNDEIWEKEIDINVTAACYGSILAMDKYLPKHKSGEDALVVNISSTAGIRGYGSIPVYTATKHAVLGMVRAWGYEEFYAKTHVRFVAACPGVTMTPLIFDMPGRNLGHMYEEWLQNRAKQLEVQEPEFVGQEMIKVIKHAPNGTAWIIEGGHTAYQYIFPDEKTMKNNVIC